MLVDPAEPSVTGLDLSNFHHAESRPPSSLIKSLMRPCVLLMDGSRDSKSMAEALGCFAIVLLDLSSHNSPNRFILLI